MNAATSLVITVPDGLNSALSQGEHRATAGIVAQLFHEAKAEIVIVSPFITAESDYFGGESLFSLLAAACQRGVRVLCFLSRGGADDFQASGLQDQLPGLKLYSLQYSSLSDGLVGSHAKIVIADGNQMYVGSANFTYSGMHYQLEVGVHVQGSVAEQCRAFWSEITSTNLFKLH